MNVKSCLAPDGNARLTGVRIAQQSSYVMTVPKKACHIWYLQCYQFNASQSDVLAERHCTGCNRDFLSEHNCLACRNGKHSLVSFNAKIQTEEVTACAY